MMVKYTSLTDSIIEPYIQSVFAKILKANPQLKDYILVVTSTPIMNAVNVGGHVIIFYVPLLSIVETESQLASVLCHEIAHGELNHVETKVKSRFDTFYSQEFQKELNKTLSE